MASPRRTFLNKINKRIASLEKVGVNKETMLNWVQDQKIDGVFITEFGQVNIDPAKWKEDEEYFRKELESAVMTVYDSAEEALRPYKDFIGPLSKDQINKEVRSMWEMKVMFESQMATYYELKEAMTRAARKMENVDRQEDAMFKIQEIWQASKLRKAPFSQLLGDIQKIQKDFEKGVYK